MNHYAGETKWWALWRTDLYGNYHVVEAGLTFEQAMTARDEVHGGKGIATPDRYVTNRMNVLLAAEFADRELDYLAKGLNEGLTFGRSFVLEGTPAYWLFVRECDEWVADGKIPGRLSCAIDKVDGSVWAEAQQERFLLDQRPND